MRSGISRQIQRLRCLLGRHELATHRRAFAVWHFCQRTGCRFIHVERKP